MTRVYPVVAVVLTLLTHSLTDASILCTWTKVLSNSEVHYSFLRGDPSSLRLYHSIWSPVTLLSCSFSDNKAIIQKYTTMCQENRQTFSQQLDLSSDFVFDVEEQCTSLDSPQNAAHEEHSFKRRLGRSAHQEEERSGVTSKLRVKRGFIVPGTLWCGSGNKAPSYSDLGLFSETDKCCREHDQCQDTILSFHSKFGVFNRNIFTMSHCDCDNKFRSCLKDAQDSISDVVGYTFFNLLKMHCFEFSYRLQCTERNWFGMCKETKMALYAEVHSPTLYEEDVNATSLNMTINTTTTSTPVHNITQAFHPSMSTVPTLLTQTVSITPTSIDTPVTATTVLPTRPPQQPLPLPDAYITESQNSCAVFKYLDECRNRILPLQRKYGFLNNEPRTMYHCNCTNRLFQSLAALPVLTEVQTLLLNHVAQSCFVLHNCMPGQICKVVVVGTQLSQVEASSTAHVKEQRHLQAMRLNVRRPTLRRATKVRSTRLHRLCLRMVLPQIHKSRRRHTKETTRMNG